MDQSLTSLAPAARATPYARQQDPADRIVTLLTWAAGLGALLYTVFNFYAVNKGFSLWDEAYYLLSYQMAVEGFYRHFNNTPFLVAFLFEPFRPGLIGYRLIHLVLNFAGAVSLAYGVIRYVRAHHAGLPPAAARLLIALACLSAAYTYPISVSTLSYNHLNEFLVLVSLALCLAALAESDRPVRSGLLMFAAGATLALDIYVKPPSFISILLAELAILLLHARTWSTRGRLAAALLTGCLASFAASLLLFYPPSQWASYLSLMREQKAHEPFTVLMSFLSSAGDMFRASAGVILSGLALSASAALRQRVGGTARQALTAALLVLTPTHLWFAWRFFLPQEIWTSFQIHWWYWWVYSSTTLLILATISLVTFAVASFAAGWRRAGPLLLLAALLAATPLGLAVGTLNGFGQVQIYAAPWLLLAGLAIVFTNTRMVAVRVHAGLFLAAFLAIGAVYVYRQQQPQNFSGQGALREQKHAVGELTPLRGMLVDKPTRDFLLQTKRILDRHPGAPTLVFFDLPGMQYVFGRPWVVLDPWLSNYEQPRTKDNAYNCQAITGHPERLPGAILIVHRAKHIDAELAACLARVGFPDRLELLGRVEADIASMEEPVSIYRFPSGSGSAEGGTATP